MKKAHVITAVVFIVGMILSSACNRAGNPPANTSAPVASASSNSRPPQNPTQPSTAANSNVGAPAAKEPASSGDAKTGPQLLGQYQAREIEDKGVVTMVSSVQTTFYFLADGTYSRESKKNGRTYHSDSGRFRIEPPDKLVLTILLSGQGLQQTIQKPPIEKTHKFTLSPDGEELKLTSEAKGSAAIFRRISKPKAGGR